MSDKICEQVLAAIPAVAPGLSYQAIHAKIGMWSIITVKHAVRQLREEGLVVREGSHQQPEFRKST